MHNKIEIIPFSESLAKDFEALNLAWLKKYFSIEPIDKEMLSNPKSYFIDKGGHIFFATYNGKVAGTFALMKTDNESYELSKMAVNEEFQGLKIGHTLLQFAIERSKELGAKKLILFSSTKLAAAIHLYRKYGFKEVPLGNSEYKRSDIKMEKELA